MSVLPFESLAGEARELGLVVGVAVGFAFGFVLERAGFGRVQKLVGQFYGSDMTVFKVMFTAIVTAMLGVVLLGGLGVVDLRALGEGAASATYLWPMLVGGLLLGVGFIVSGYCPGTSVVAAASGKLDGLATVAGVVVGSLLYAEAQPLLGGFHTSGDLGHRFLHDLVGVPPAALALAITGMAVAAFVGAEWVERRVGGTAAPAPRPRTVVWAGLGATSALALLTLLVPTRVVATARTPQPLTALELARHVVEAPWGVRVVDLRAREACLAQRVPGAECASGAELAPGAAGRDVVLVGEGDVAQVPAALAAHPGRVLALTGGFAAWQQLALRAPPALAPGASAQARADWQLRTGLHAAMTGARPAPPPAVPAAGAAPARRKAAGGGCGG